MYIAVCLTILVYGSESWCLREGLFNLLRRFYSMCCRAMRRVNKRHSWRHRISSAELYKRLRLQPFDYFYNSRLLRWAGYVARMPMDRTPRRLLTGWVSSPRPRGAPQMTFGRTLNKALKASGITTDFAGWQQASQDRVTWRAAIRA